MDQELREKLIQAVWVARSLFERGKTAGSTANISFRHEGYIYISGSGTCFGTLKEADFAKMTLDGRHIDGIKPSKEYPMHQILYQRESVGAVIHTHSFYAVLWSCLNHADAEDVIPEYTPYLKMKLGRVGMVPYALPGSRRLFESFEACMGGNEGYLLQNHGPIVAGSDMMDAFYKLEELEESTRIAWSLRMVPEEEKIRIV